MQEKSNQFRRFKVKGVQIDDSDGVETHYIATNQLHCKKCGKTRFHDIYVEIIGDEIIQIQPFAVCKDCLFEIKGEVGEAGLVFKK